VSRPLRVYLVAGEASGDRLGAPLIAALRAEREAEFRGVGGELMASEGLESLFDNADLAVMGLAEVLPRLPVILRRMRETVADVAAFEPDVLITIDSPGFGLRVARKAKAARPGLRTVHYVAPSVWAWRPGRAREMARYIDHVLALLPFEPPWMEAAGMSCDFVGHPAARLSRPEAAETAALRAEIGAQGRPLLAVLPGSRRGEVARLAPVFGEILGRVKAQVPDLAVVLPAASGVAQAAAEAARAWPVAAHVLDPRGLDPAQAEARKFRAFAAADAALAASGTVALELAAMGAPQVTAYRVNALTAAIARRLIRIETANLVNILDGGRPVPEFLQEALQPGPAAAAVARLLTDPQAARAQRAAAARALEALGRGEAAPSVRAARSVLRVVERD
jgi:lipid-A-disaccharide synthase